MGVAIAPPAPDYPAHFRRYIVQSVALSLDEARAAGTLLAEAAKSQAIHILDFALRMEEAWPLLSELLLHLSPIMERRGDRWLWISYLERALLLGQQLNDQRTAAQLHWSLGLLYRQVSTFAVAEAHLSQSQTLAAAQGLARLQAQALIELAHLAQLQDQLGQADALLQQALPLLPPNDPECAAAYSVLSDLFYKKAEWSQAATAMQRAIALWVAHGQFVAAAGGWRGLARVHWGQHDFAAAVACYEQAIALYDTVDDPIQRAITCLGFGGLYVAHGEAPRALPWLMAAETTLLQVQDEFHLAMLYLNYGIAYRLTGSWSAAHHALDKSLAYYERRGDRVRQVNGLMELSELYLASGADDQARATLCQLEQLLHQLPPSAAVSAQWQALPSLWQRLAGPALSQGES